MVIDVLKGSRVDLHLADKHGLECGGHCVPGRDILVPLRQLGVRRDHAEGLLAGEDLFTQFVPALIELALVLSDQTSGT